MKSPPAAADNTQRHTVIESGLFIAFLGVLLWAPLPFASNRPWAMGLLALLVGLLTACWLILYLIGRVGLAPAVWRSARWAFYVLAGVQLWVLVQCLPLPAEVVGLLSPQAYAWQAGLDRFSLSLDTSATRLYLLRGCTLVAAFFLALALVNNQRRLRLLLQVLVFSGTFQAVYGAFMALSGLELGFLVEKYTGLGVATGTFVNRNHLAGYLVMCLAAGTGLLLSQLTFASHLGWRDRLRYWLATMLSAKVRLRIYLALMVIALVLTRSRMGNVAFFTSLGLAGAAYVYAIGRFSPGILAFLGSLLLVDLLILGRWFGFDKLVQRLEQTSGSTEGRVESNIYTLDYLQAFPVTGSGGGSYYGIFPNFQPLDMHEYYDHAHNDYLEFSVELGLPATLMLLLAVLQALIFALRVLRERRTPLFRGTAFCVVMTVCWAGLHSLVDFNLQIPANALTFITILALAFVASGLPGNESRRVRRPI